MQMNIHNLMGYTYVYSTNLQHKHKQELKFANCAEFYLTATLHRYLANVYLSRQCKKRLSFEEEESLLNSSESYPLQKKK